MALSNSTIETWIHNLACPSCHSPLSNGRSALTCLECMRSWPVEDGVPRFWSDATYWGELSPTEASRLVEEARSLGWRQAVEHRFGDRRDMIITFCDWQRASWLTLLGLRGDAWALDIGSGYGAITHSLARSAYQVYSLEAVRPRLDFTNVRLAQEGLNNVHLIQASALDIPLRAGLFDLIVVNGILEWIGEWATEGKPGSAQLRFLRGLCRLLKPSGTVLIGIENRIGYGVLRGAVDHSGLRYTSLLPRWAASMALRHFRPQHDRTTINPKGEYRTYTYSKRGYRKLLAAAGFSSAEFYWVYPSYNQPYHVAPLKSALIRRGYRRHLGYATSASPKRWRRWLKAVLCAIGPPPSLVSEFLIVARKEPNSAGAARQALWRVVSSDFAEPPTIQDPVFDAITHPFGEKTLIRVYNEDFSHPVAVLKASTPAPESRRVVETEFQNLLLAHRCFASRPNPPFIIARPLGSARLGQIVYTGESTLSGREFSQRLTSGFSRKPRAALRSDLQRCIEVAAEIAGSLEGQLSVRQAPASVWGVPEGVQQDADFVLLWRAVGHDSGSIYPSTVQHGDFTVFNILQDKAGRLAVVDWGSLVRGVPPLYDAFSFLITALPAVSCEGSAPGTATVVREQQFLTAFFGTGPWADFTKEMLLLVSDRLRVKPRAIWPMFVQSLVVRANFYRLWRSEEEHRFVRFMRLLPRHADRFVLA